MHTFATYKHKHTHTPICMVTGRALGLLQACQSLPPSQQQ